MLRDIPTSFKDFGIVTTQLIDPITVPNTASAAESDEFYSCRLIVKGKKAGLSFKQYNPKAVVEGPENYYVLYFPTRSATQKAFAKLCNDTRLVYVEPDAYTQAEASLGTSRIKDSITYNSWGVSKIGADKYAEFVRKKTDSNITVAVLDTGVGNHSFINYNVMKGLDFVNLDNNSVDLAGHGTWVTGIVLDCTQGLNVKVLGIRVVDENGCGTQLACGNGIRYAVDCGAKIINMSLRYSHSQYLDDAIDYAYKKDAIIIAASGNDYGSTENGCPSHNPKAIVVGAVDKNLSRAKFSNIGKSLDIVAPGVGIESTKPGNRWATSSGTSASTPYISAAAAMIRLANPGKRNVEIENILYNSCVDLGDKGWDPEYGHGIPDLSKLISGMTTPTPTPRPTITPVPEKTKYYALVIGHKYGDDDRHQKDFLAVSNMFTQHGYTKVVGGSSPVLADAAYSKATKDDVLVFYYSGEIAQVTTNGIQKEILMILNDDQQFGFAELRSIMDQYPGKKVILLDCAYAGAVVSKNGTIKEKKDNSTISSVILKEIKRVFINGVPKNGEFLSGDYTVLVSCANDKMDAVMTDGNGNYWSNFTRWLCAGCGYDRVNFKESSEMAADADKDNKVTMKELLDYIISIEKLNNVYHTEPILYPSNSQLVLVNK